MVVNAFHKNEKQAPPYLRRMQEQRPPRARGALPLEAVGRWTHTFSRCPASVAACSKAKMSPHTATEYLQRLQNESKTTRSTEQQRALRSIIALFGATTRSTEHHRTLRSINALFGAETRSTEQKRHAIIAQTIKKRGESAPPPLLYIPDPITILLSDLRFPRNYRHNSYLPSFLQYPFSELPI